MKKIILALCALLLCVTAGCAKKQDVAFPIRSSFSFSAATDRFSLVLTEKNVIVTDNSGVLKQSLCFCFEDNTLTYGTQCFSRTTDGVSVLTLGLLMRDLCTGNLSYEQNGHTLSGSYRSVPFTLRLCPSGEPEQLTWGGLTAEFET